MTDLNTPHSSPENTPDAPQTPEVDPETQEENDAAEQLQNNNLDAILNLPGRENLKESFLSIQESDLSPQEKQNAIKKAIQFHEQKSAQSELRTAAETKILAQQEAKEAAQARINKARAEQRAINQHEKDLRDADNAHTREAIKQDRDQTIRENMAQAQAEKEESQARVDAARAANATSNINDAA